MRDGVALAVGLERREEDKLGDTVAVLVLEWLDGNRMPNENIPGDWSLSSFVIDSGAISLNFSSA